MKSTTKTTKTMKHQANFYAMALPILIFASFMLPPFGGIEGGFAQAPPRFNYQGIARDNVGNELMNQAISLRISILKGSPSGTESYKEIHDTITNEFGLFTVRVGGGAPVTGQIDTISWGSDEYFLKVEMNLTGDTNYQFMGTSQFLSVPYALYADSAGAAPGSSAQILSISLNGDTLSISGGNSVVLPDSVNDADADPTNELQTLSINGNSLSISGGDTVTLPSGGADSDWIIYGDTLYSTPDSTVTIKGGNVGIGTTEPGAPLDVRYVDGGNIITIGGGIAQVGAFGFEIGSITYLSANSAGYSLGFRAGASATDQMRLTSTGNVGIGTTNPGTRLHVAGAIGDGATIGKLMITDDAPFYTGANINSQSNPLGIGGTGAVTVGFFTNNLERMKITSSGNIGIGTSTPTTKLEVAGQVKITGGVPGAGKVLTASDTTGLATWQTPAGAPDNDWTIDADTLYSAADSTVTIKGGKVGIGIASPSSQFHLKGNGLLGGVTALVEQPNPNSSANLFLQTSGGPTDRLKLVKNGSTIGGTLAGVNLNNLSEVITLGNGALIIGTTSPNHLHVITGNQERLRIDSIGNVGIGTASPTEKLDVVGSGKVSGTIYVGSGGLTQLTAGQLQNTSGGLTLAGSTGLFLQTSGGNVGIGTTAPLIKLDTRGANAKATTAAFQNIFSVASTDVASPLSLQMGIKTDATATLRYGAIEIDDAGTKRHLILNPTPSSSGYVGIGTTSPNFTLHIKGGTGPGQQGYVRIEDIDPTGLSTLELKNNAGGSFFMYKLSSGYPTSGRFVPGIALLENNHAAGLALSEVTGDIHFYTAGNNERMTIKNAGNVGIGTTSPAGKFHVNNDVVGSDSSFVILQSGNVGIGTTGPVSRLQVEDPSASNAPEVLRGLTPNVPDGLRAGLILFGRAPTTGQSGHIEFVGNPASGEEYISLGINSKDDKLVIKGNGNVGIGTTSPSFPLHVQKSAANIFAASIENQDAAGWGLEVRTADVSSTRNALEVRTGGTSRFLVRNDGNVGIGITPLGQFELSLDQGRKPSTNTWTIVSDERLKNVESKYQKGLKEVLQLQPITYYYKNAGERTFKEEVLRTLNVGFSAQEVQKIFPEAVGVDADGYLNFNMHSILVAYTNAIKELEKENQSLKTEIANLKSDYGTRIRTLEEISGTKAGK